MTPIVVQQNSLSLTDHGEPVDAGSGLVCHAEFSARHEFSARFLDNLQVDF